MLLETGGDDLLEQDTLVRKDGSLGNVQLCVDPVATRRLAFPQRDLLHLPDGWYRLENDCSLHFVALDIAQLNVGNDMADS